MEAKFDEVFAMFDSDGSGVITCKELKNIIDALKDCGYDKAPVGDTQVAADKILEIANKDADGKITKEEFRKYMEEAIAQS